MVKNQSTMETTTQLSRQQRIVNKNLPVIITILKSCIKSKSLKIIFIIIFLTGILADAQNTPKIITVDVRKNDKLNLSEIAEDITPINLVKLEGVEVGHIVSVLVNPKYLFVQTVWKREEDNKEIHQILQYSIDGKFIRNIEKYNNETNELILPRKIFHDDQSKNILISYRDGSLSTLNSSGELLSTQEKISIGEVYNNYIWSFENSPDIENNKNWVLLTRASMDGQTKDTIMKYATDDFHYGKINAFYNVNNKLYFFTDVANFVYSIDKKSAIKKEYEFRFINGAVQRSILGFKFLFNKYIYYDYMSDKRLYTYLYNRETGSGLNFKERPKSPDTGFVYPQITDDILNTGYVRIFPTNSPDYIFFEGREAEREKLNLDIKNPNSFILLVKLK